MRKIALLFVVLALADYSFANALYHHATESGSLSMPDSTVRKNRKTEFKVTLGKSDDATVRDKSDSTKNTTRHSGVSFGLTFARFDLGFAKLIDNGSFTLSPQNDFLEYNSWKTSNVGFDLVQFGYRFNSHFKVYLSGGFDWTHIRLEKDITIRRNAPVLEYDASTVHFDKNRFSSTYLRIPLSFELRTKDDDRGKKFRFVFGPDMGFLLNGRVKQKSSENGKQKFNDDYHFTKFRYGAFARIGYGAAGLYAKYYFNDTFENSPQQNGIRNMAFGITVGF